VGGGKKISWVKWEAVCQQKSKGGLGVKDIRVMNMSLLAKWRWRLLDGENTLWKEVVDEKYGPCVGENVGGGHFFLAKICINLVEGFCEFRGFW